MLKPQKLFTPLVVFFFGMSRSGNHPIIQWIMSQEKKEFIFFNDIRSENGNAYNVLRQTKKRKADFVICSYEGNTFDEFYSSFPVKNVKAEGIKRIILLRDPFNLAASQYFYFGNISLPRRAGRTLSEIWKEHAKEYLGRTDKLENKIPISYNKWFIDKEYRKNIADQLGLKFTDKGINRVSNFAGGSSFDQMRYDGSAQEMKTLSRFETLFYSESAIVEMLLGDKELLALAKEFDQDSHDRFLELANRNNVS